MQTEQTLQHPLSPADHWAAALASLIKSCYLYRQNRTPHQKRLLQFTLLTFLLEDRAMSLFEVPVPLQLKLSDRAHRLVKLVRDFAAKCEEADVLDDDFDADFEAGLLQIGDFGDAGDALEGQEHETI